MALDPAENQHERILPKPEADVLRKRMAADWGVDRHYWWPLSDPRPPHTEGFQDYFFEQEFGYAALRRILTEHGVTNVFEFREDGEAYEVRVATFEPCYTGLEGFWTSDRFDWILYASHESSVTVGGEWLLPAVQAAWPSWEQRVWTSPFYESHTQRRRTMRYSEPSGSVAVAIVASVCWALKLGRRVASSVSRPTMKRKPNT